jgi:hypothetical protein
VGTKVTTFVRVAAVAVVAALLRSPSLAGQVEIFGRPLRGLTQVRISEVLRDPGALGNRAFRISGRCERTAAGSLAVRDGEASVVLQTVRFSVPEDAVGARISAEGRLGKDDAKNPVRFLADGVEVAR